MRSYRRRCIPRPLFIVAIVLIAMARCRDNSGSRSVGRVAEEPKRDTREIETALQTTPAAPPRDGIAAAVVIDVSGSMDDRVVGEDGRRARKIDVARRAARDVIEQFASYAEEHKDETVNLGVFEFSRRDKQPDCRPIVPMGPPDRSRAEEALARLDPGGGTPIGQAMVTAKQALDATGLSRRHLLIVSDGENTDGFEPQDVTAAIAKRPDTDKPSIYFVAFDIEAQRFNGVRDAGGLVLPAANAKELNTTLETLIKGKILLER